ncbi:HemK2/MTQ2 family protein methyltransferase [Streptomyces nymphaeiformis]|jgi:release factor glutamine methyltransferase|uniref:Release factor glutamine methyltransferase n=1 Tax=Streptomyces nymphaeiformis TaxID=2663842 RepID=A0A7W7U567_9ACTN|nr:HemK2/MTQ2 family protein methyltransferase [Streptomyces nymphaeiformis]MBB4984851.1 release factor glutamine methyltransferase [Streptomyces nymphaeiformis]
MGSAVSLRRFPSPEERPAALRVCRLPGVYAPQADTRLLVAQVRHEALWPGVRSLDLCTGTGIVAVAAALRGARATAVDVSRAAVAASRLNALLHGCRIRVLRGDLDGPVGRERFDLVTVNPPYVPSQDARAPSRGARRSWDAGRDGRLLLDRICVRAPGLLTPSGVLLLVQSSLSGVAATLDALGRGGLRTRVVERRTEPFGPVMSARAEWFAALGLIAPGAWTEELVVIRACRS